MTQQREESDAPAGTLVIGVCKTASVKVFVRDGSKTVIALLSDATSGPDELGRNWRGPIWSEWVG